MGRPHSIPTKLAITTAILRLILSGYWLVSASAIITTCQNPFLEMLMTSATWSLSSQHKGNFQHQPSNEGGCSDPWFLWHRLKRREVRRLRNQILCHIPALFTLKLNIFIELKVAHYAPPIKKTSTDRGVFCVLSSKAQTLFMCLHFWNAKYMHLMWYPFYSPETVIKFGTVSNNQWLLIHLHIWFIWKGECEGCKSNEQT